MSQVRPCLHDMGGDPNIVGRYRPPLAPQGPRYRPESLRRLKPQPKSISERLGQEIFQERSVLRKSLTVSEAEQQLANDDHRHKTRSERRTNSDTSGSPRISGEDKHLGVPRILG
jgi:hypothetical protein